MRLADWRVDMSHRQLGIVVLLNDTTGQDIRGNDLFCFFFSALSLVSHIGGRFLFSKMKYRPTCEQAQSLASLSLLDCQSTQ